jgi:hypothetical protein
MFAINERSSLQLPEDGSGVIFAELSAQDLALVMQVRRRNSTFPGCHHDHFIGAQHTQHWVYGDGASLGNLTLLCTHHHRLVHEGGYGLRQLLMTSASSRAPMDDLRYRENPWRQNTLGSYCRL